MVKLYITLSILMALLAACDAPRENPLDPNNPDNSISSVSGVVMSEYLPNEPLPGTEVFWKDRGIITQTDDQGRFEIEVINREDGWLFFSKSGFGEDSVYIDWKNQNKISFQILLNSLPKADSVEFYSIVQNKYAPGPEPERLYNFVIRAAVFDKEGDIDSVFLKNKSLSFLERLEYNPDSKFYRKTFSNFDLGLQKDRVDEVVGKEFEILVDAASGDRIKVASTNIKRIIKDEIEFISPANSETVSVPFNLSWKRFTPGFSFDYLLQIYTDEISEELVWEEKVSSEKISYLMEEEIPEGDYFWVIWSIDEYMNRSRSRPATFILE